MDFINSSLAALGLSPEYSVLVVRAVALAVVIVLSFLANLVAGGLVLRGVRYLVGRTETGIDDIFLERKVFDKLSRFAPALVIYLLAPMALRGFENVSAFVTGAAMIYMIVIALVVVDSLLNAILEIYRTFEASKEIPIKGFLQVVKIVVFFIGLIFIVSIVLGKSPLYLISGLGALTAVLLLIFKDSLLGFIAGIQLITNKMIAHGDWVEIPKYGADGDVLEITLTTVKVQNFDKTITTVPTYALISDSFKNWRGMEESDGRRIKRSVNIDLSTIKLSTETEIERYAKIDAIKGYIEEKKRELAEYNEAHGVDESVAVNGRRLTNVGTFRAYLISYLKNHPMINKDMTLLVRQLAPSELGLPIELYIFTKDKNWINYEAIQADIFDHVLAVVPEFDLKVFQSPSGSDFKGLNA
ncbi:MAG: mechanosensitive ion channel [Proteobacteria bacterium]|nr:mechanosensitive ion channel [Pseudomonadota bacterium]